MATSSFRAHPAREAGGRQARAHRTVTEQLRGGEVDARTDIYALGVTLYEMLTGRQPFEAADDRGLIRKIASAAPVPPRTYRPDLPPALEALTLRALARDPDARFASAESFAAALRDWLAPLEVPQPPVEGSPPAEAPQAPAASTLPGWLGAGLGLALGGLAGWATGTPWGGLLAPLGAGLGFGMGSWFRRAPERNSPWTLVVASGTGTGRRIPVPAGGLRIGRGEACELVLDDPGVSSLHASIEPGEEGWRVCDRGSRNGIWVGGQRVEEAPLLHQGLIVLGETTLLCEFSN